jgi:adenosylhomocysteine nucleosidase
LKYLGIVVATIAEARSLMKQRIAVGQLIHLREGVLIQISGIGAERAGLAARTLLKNGATALLSWGSAGGLIAKISAGSLILPKAVIAADRSVYPIDAVWHERLFKRLDGFLDIHTEVLAESTTILTNSMEKRDLSYKTGAIAVDMESAAIAVVAQEADLPFMIVRATADTADMVIPLSVLTAMDEFGRSSLLKVIRGLIKHPAELRELIRLEQNFRAAQTTLAKVARLAGSNLLVP